MAQAVDKGQSALAPARGLPSDATQLFISNAVISLIGNNISAFLEGPDFRLLNKLRHPAKWYAPRQEDNEILKGPVLLPFNKGGQQFLCS